MYTMPLEMVRRHPGLVLELLSVAYGGQPTGYRGARHDRPDTPAVALQTLAGDWVQVDLVFARSGEPIEGRAPGMRVVVCFDEEAAARHREADAVVVGPREFGRWYSLERAVDSPEVATLCAIASADPDVHASVAKALLLLTDERGSHYYSYLCSSLPTAHRARMESLVMGESYLLIDDAVTTPFWEAGRRHGRREMLRWLLAHRGLKVDRVQDEAIEACTRTATVQEWTRRALTATSAAEVFIGVW
ncbi:hypothetical protein [Nonomuraea typhae]|uniref:hypothetical protein n=1 Tax=Nonomuraea typhae TaxID=2603600 RepID=UPI0012F81444|nr:hypothetical protein [Nonomuraea typhae]